MALFPKLAAKPHKGLSTCYGQLGFQRGPLQRWPPMGGAFPNHRPQEPLLSLLAGEHLWKRGPGRGGDRGGTQRGTRTQGNANPSALANASVGILWEQRSPRRAGGLCITAPSVPSTCSESPRAPQWPRWPGSGLAFFLAPFHQPFSPPSSPGAPGKEVASRDERRRRRGEI